MTRSLAFMLIAASLGLVAAAQAQTVTVTGPDGRVATLSHADLAAMPRQAVALDQHGKVSTYEGALLGDVVARVGAATGKAIRGPEMATVVRVTASDGYQVVLGLAEIDPDARRDRVILADRADGEPLAADGPFRLVVEGDLRPARSARNVERIEVLRLATAPGAKEQE